MLMNEWILFLTIATTLGNVSGTSLETLVWPMNNKTFTVEIQNISIVRSVPCGMEFTSGPPGYPEAGAANFDGVKFIDQKVNFAPRTVDYSLSGLFRMSNLDGTLLHYSDDAGIFQIMLWVKNGTLYMERHSATIMIHTYFPGVVDSHIWYFVSVGVDYGGGKLIIQLIQTGTGTAVELTREIEKDIEFTMPGTLRIGGMQDSSQPNLEGSATCVAFYFGERQPTESVAKEQCIAYTAGAYLQSLCTTNAGERTQNQAGIFKMTEGVNMNSLTQIASFPRCSEVQCAFSCMTDRSCWYYTILKFNPVCGRCLLFGGTVSLLGVSGDSHANLFRLNG